MNPGQEKFLNFILERVQDGKRGEAKSMLEECFKKQDAGAFGPEDAKGLIPKMLPLLKPEALKEVKDIMTQFGGSK